MTDDTDHDAIWLTDRIGLHERAFADRHGQVGDGITVGTVLEYDGWQWAMVSELTLDRKTPKIGFILLDEVDDYVIQRLEVADGCAQHYAAVEHLRHSEHEYWTPVEYVVEDDVWSVLGPIHPEARSQNSRSVDADIERSGEDAQ